MYSLHVGFLVIISEYYRSASYYQLGLYLFMVLIANDTPLTYVFIYQSSSTSVNFSLLLVKIKFPVII